MLRAARYDVDLDPQLDIEPLNTAGQQLLHLTDQIRASTEFDELAGVLDNLLDPDDGALVRLQEALEVASEQITDLDPEQYELSDRFGAASDQLVSAQAELAGAVDEVQRVKSHAHGTADGRATASYSAAVHAARAASPAVAARGVNATVATAAAAPPAAGPRPSGRTR